MNYLKSITSSVLNSTGVSFPFSIGDRIAGLDPSSSIWEIKEGVKKDDGTLLTLFIFDSTLPPLQPGNRDRRSLLQLARNALKKLRTIRHPDVLRYIDSVETETHVYVATERVRPLEAVLRDWDTGGGLSSGSKGKEAKENWIGWGVKGISTALSFLNSPPLSQHHSYLLPSAVFITPSLEWRLAGFELLSGRDDAAGVLYVMGGIAPGNVGERCGPEVKKGGWGVLRDTDPAQSDTYLLALLLFTLYNPRSPLPSLTSAPTPASAGSLPRALFPLYKRMLNPNPRTRLSTMSFVSEAAATDFWESNPLASLVDGLDGFELRSDGEKASLLKKIKDESSDLPQPFLAHRVLPSLLHSLSLPTAPSSTMLPLILSLGKLVPPSDYGKLVLDPVVRLYSSPDRGTRMALLDGLGEYAEKLDARMVQDKVWPYLITGFADTVPVIREATIKAVYPLAAKLSDRILNNDLLRLLAKMQMDTEPSIRTNTCILLGRLAPSLGPNTKKKVLVPAFARSLKDPFVHARVAGLMAMMATISVFDRDDLASKVIPNMSFTLVDKEKLVRDQAFKAMALFMGRIEADVAAMPDSVLNESRPPGNYGPITASQSSGDTTDGSGVVSSATGAAGALASWAIASLGKQLASTEIHSEMTAVAHAAVPGSLTTLPSSFADTDATGDPTSRILVASRDAAVPAILASAGSRSLSSFVKAPETVARSNGPSAGMKLGGAKSKVATRATGLADVLAEDFESDEMAKAWGTDDLMDVNADADDWTAFESAPLPVVVPPAQAYYVMRAQESDNLVSSSLNLTATPKRAPPAKQDLALASEWNNASSSPALTRNPGQFPNSTASSRMAGMPASEVAPEEWGDEQGLNGLAISKPGSTSNMASMSKEEKEKEMARRREERKARISAMKEQKRAKT